MMCDTHEMAQRLQNIDACGGIPPMVDPLSRHWQQPPRENVLIDATHALCSRRDFDALLEYSTTIPTGAYIGKMWKRLEVSGWLLCWYGPAEPGFLTIESRPLLIVESAGAS